MQSAIPIRVQIGAFELHLKSGDLRQGAQRIHLQGQPFQILLMLVERAGELVTREEIKKKLWPNDTVVEFDDSIHTALKKLRQALGDAADNPKYVETVARRGYRLIVPVECLESTPADRPTGEEGSNGGDGASARLQLAPTGMTGRTLSHYRVLDVIGGGGMGVVYRAEDLKLGRCVALKFLPEELGSDPHALERFSREARAASSLDHPNICAIHEFGEHEGRPFMVMQLLEGQTLRDRLTDTASEGALPLEELLEIGIQVSDGLQAAHEKGIIHRDIKPANIFITNKGVCKILDFGLVKLLEADQEDEVAQAQDEPSRSASTALTLTRTGTAMGTAGYMSPEQVRGERLDPRSDLFSFGLILYEMATGQRAFTGDTAAALKDAILNNVPLPVHELNATLPTKLEKIVGKATEKQRERRYQSAADMRADLQILSGRTQHRVVHRHWKLLVSAAIVLAAVVGGVLYWRLHRTIHLSEKDTMVLADFANSTGDPVFDGALKQALAIQLEQSPFLNVLSDKQVSDTLKLMQHPVTERLTEATAQEVCTRANSRAVLAGSIAPAGDGYRIELKTVDFQSGDTLATAEAESADRNKVLSALAEAANRLRQKLGESLGSVQKFSQPLEEATTSSLEALQAYTQGRKKQAEQGEAAAVPYFKLAVDLDPTFAYAYVSLGISHFYLYEYSQAATNLSKAYDLRQRVSQRERFAIEGYYYGWVTGEMDKMGQAHMEWARTYSRDYIPHLRLNAYYRFMGQFEKAVGEASQALELSPDNAASVYALMIAYVRMNRFDDAIRVYEDARARKLDSPIMHGGRYIVAFLQRDDATMRDLVESAKGKPLTEELQLAERFRAEAYYGRLKQAHALIRAAGDLAEKAGSPERAALWKTLQALTEAEVDNPEVSRRVAAEALAASTGPHVSMRAALAFALCGDYVQAKKMADTLAHEHPLDTEIQYCFIPPVRAGIALGLNQPNEAINILAASIPYELGDAFLIPAYLRGLAYLQAGKGPQAAGEFQKLLDHPGVLESDVKGALAHLQLGRAQAMMGDKAAARKSYQDFLILWKDADPDIPVYQQAKAEYARLR
jgi:eukaryotic-like serine/threonine-protein kinase